MRKQVPFTHFLTQNCSILLMGLLLMLQVATSQAQSLQILPSPVDQELVDRSGASRSEEKMTEFNGSVYFIYRNTSSSERIAKYTEGSGVKEIAHPAGALQAIGNFVQYGGNLYCLYYSSNNVIQLGKIVNDSIMLIPNPVAGSGVETSFKPVVYNGELYCGFRNAQNLTQMARFNGTTLTVMANPNPDSISTLDGPQWVVADNKLFIPYFSTAGKARMLYYNGSSFTLLPNPVQSGNIRMNGGFPVSYNNQVYVPYQTTAGTYHFARFNSNGGFLIPNPVPTGGVNNSVPVVYNGKLYVNYFLPGSISQLGEIAGDSLRLIPNPAGMKAINSDMVLFQNKLAVRLTSTDNKFIIHLFNGTTFESSTNPDNGTGVDKLQAAQGNLLYTGYRDVNQKMWPAFYNGRQVVLLNLFPDNGSGAISRVFPYNAVNKAIYYFEYFSSLVGFKFYKTVCDPPSAVVVQQTNPLCFKDSSGRVSVSYNATFRYRWLPYGGDSSVARNLVAGNYSCIVTNSCGAQDTVEVTLTDPAIQQTTNNIQLCEGESYTLGSKTYSVTGQYTDSVSSPTGCRSLVITNLTINPRVRRTIQVNVCAGDSFTIANRSYAVSGTYTDTLVARTGCDSIVTTILTVRPLNISNQSVTICAGASFAIGSNLYDATGVYTDTLISAAGCDSIVTTNLTVTPRVRNSINPVICAGNVFAVGNRIYDVTGLYTDTLMSAAGCDSIVTTNLTVRPENRVDRAVQLCAGESIVFEGNTYDSAGIYSFVFTAANGCDSTIVINLSFADPIDVSVTVSRATITATANDPKFLYQWIDCGNGGAVIENETEATFTAQSNGSYAVIVRNGECADTSECILISNLGLSSVNATANLLSVFPNPASGVVTLQPLHSQGQWVEVISPLGQSVYKQYIETNQSIDLSAYANGIYTIRIATETQTQVIKLLKQ